MAEKRLTRRDMIKKAVYVAPAIWTLTAAPSFASGGSGDGDESDAHRFIYHRFGGGGEDDDHQGQKYHEDHDRRRRKH